MSKDMIERVARAICRSYRLSTGFQSSDDYTIDDEVENAWGLFVSEARAAIAAMLEPTDDMQTAGHDAAEFYVFEGRIFSQGAKVCWQAMIKRALDE